ncbi:MULTISPECIES: PaaI family thioesterase [Roseobacteraceae]|uniref:Thioesterase superfamily protein n=1 Tax=Pseudosulfitobacter pseudonitzschiae TaxID=1402135 RepID=A0A221K1J8_9RHOB|nr:MULTISPECIES: PaaI family thioesterase [Roseobacteraceae]ASM72892.1 thioesterase superfamily protein [Pseudosulfitobacter pseudonitzschiae]
MPHIAQRPEDLLSLDDLKQLSGLEFIQSILDGSLPGPPIGNTLNYTMHAAEKGRVVFRGAPEFSAANPLGTVHGGWYGTLLDSAMACAVQTCIPRGSIYTTLEFKINITRAIPLGMMIDCIGTVDHVGRSTGVSKGEIHGVEDGKLYATGSTTCIIMSAG